MRLHRVRVLRLREYRDELVIREEVEARERDALRLEVVGEVLLHALELGVRLMQDILQDAALPGCARRYDQMRTLRGVDVG